MAVAAYGTDGSISVLSPSQLHIVAKVTSTGLSKGIVQLKFIINHSCSLFYEDNDDMSDNLNS